MKSIICPHCPSVLQPSYMVCPECGIAFDGQPKQLLDGELRVSKPWRTEVCLTFVKTENFGNGYGVSKTFKKKEITKSSIDLFLNHARTLL
ncbi:hypothetical protein [Vibrio viridaestus]|uniref:Uncharacterized protein n=1 Tax=Vibrio viridaestus TaxID=2487322 RepID=A0A3N9TJI0_9VIBR|nr:hypothetical protein [Vibrio viridaestus]RQW64013.1 hypothetical protein EES38_05250 [Vibrio viridaestus]